MFRWLWLAAALLAAVPAWAQEHAFKPDAATVNLAATTTTGRVAIQVGNNSRHVRIYNSGAVTVFVECGDVTVVATTAASMPMPPGAVEVIGCPSSNIAGITASGTATVYFTPGGGL